jgi:outer membrane receptor protein involved in Fe transport
MRFAALRQFRNSLLLAALPLSAVAADIRGTVEDPSGAAIPAAQVSVVNRVGVVASATSGPTGRFELAAPDEPGLQVTVTAPGFATRTVPAAEAARIRLDIAAQVDAVKVVGSAVDVAASEMPASVSIVSAPEIRERNQSQAMDLLRYVPGLAFSQTGARGGVAGLFIRGGYPTFNLVQIDGVPVNVFGGNFDFAHVPAEALERIEVVRGPQSAIYGPYANSGVINFVTRSPESGPSLDVVAEGGTYQERRFGISGAGMLAGWGLAASASRIDADGPVPNNDYRGENLLLNVSRRFGRHALALHGDFSSNEDGVPGPWGSDPEHTFTGIDTLSRNKNNFSDYFVHYTGDFTPRLRQELTGTFFLGNSGFISPYGHSFDQNIRGQGEARTVVSVTRWYTAAFGVSAGREEVNNSFITDASSSVFPLRRRDTAVYLENRFTFGHLVVTAGIRGEFIDTDAIPADGYSRPFFPENHVRRADPKLAAAYTPRSGTRLHSSFGLGVRPPSGFDLAYTNNPALLPERTRSWDAGVEQSLLGGRLWLDATYFYNRFYDLIVTLGGSLTVLSHFQSDNLSNARAQGAEFSARLRPARWLFVTGWYTRLATRILSLDGSDALAPQPFSVGQELVRRPADSGAVVATFTRGRVTADVNGYFRGSVLDVEPSYGATNGLFRNPGYANLGINVNYDLGRGLTAYGNLRNALNRRYEEVFGFPSPLLNFTAGLRWTFHPRK